DAPMNSFWIPKLGGQIYAMSGMATTLNLEANQVGDYEGVSANISGQGFAGMRFKVHASSGAAYKNWVSVTKANPGDLTTAEYDKLVRPSENNRVSYFGSVSGGLFNSVIDK